MDSTPLDHTARYYAASRHVYAQALLELVTYARDNQADFSFGPLDLSSLEHQGLAVSGRDLTGVQEVLGRIAGLEPEQPSGSRSAARVPGSS